MIQRSGAAVLIVLVAACGRRPAPTPPSAAPPSPREAWEARSRAELAGDGAALWASLSRDARERLVRAWAPVLEELKRAGGEALDDAARECGVAPDTLHGMTVEAWLRAALGARAARLARDPAWRARHDAEKFLGADVQASTAVCRISGPGGVVETVLVLEDGAWRLRLPEPGR